MLRGKKSITLIGFILVLLLGGCGNPGETVSTEGTVEKASEQSEVNGLNGVSTQILGEDIVLKEQDDSWQDNTLDDWQAVVNAPIKDQYMEGRGIFFINGEGAVRYGSHRLEASKGMSSTIAKMNHTGDIVCREFAINEKEGSRSAFDVGPVAGGKGVVLWQCEQDETHAFVMMRFLRLDENCEIEDGFEWNTPYLSQVESVVGDSKGYYHVVDMDISTGCHYCVISPDGDIVLKVLFPLYSQMKLCITEDGRVLVLADDINEQGTSSWWKTYEADIENGMLVEHSKISTWFIDQNIKRAFSHMGQLIPYLVSKNERELFFCCDEGLYLCDAQDKEIKLLYKWEEHDISPRQIYCIYAKDNETIEVIYKDAEGDKYLLLKPTT